ncbi:PAS domain S-box protein [uncultured Maribacter sp.]|uniref:PAS domain S-box protein n=1 Tax=uncultured Maribacter sp. TaxID=431308 RepID=UPI0030EF898D|tara:strand:+ start:23444 stop:25288 length:1845 start_codon:yes stop_codon:yes gene_type:complete
MLKSINNTSLPLNWIGQIPSSIAIIDSNFNIINASPRWLANFRLDLQDIEGKNIGNLFPDISEKINTNLAYSLDGLRDIKFKYNAKNCQYSSNDTIWHLNPWKDGYGKIIGVIIKVEPITNSHKLELELSRTKLILKQKSSVAKIGSWEYDVQNKTLSWTPVINKIFGVSKNYRPTLEKVLAFYLEGNSRNTKKKIIDNAICSGKPWNEKLQLKREDGTIIWVNTIGRPKYSEGKCNRVIGTIQNITDTVKDNSKQLTKSSDDYPLFEKVPFGLAIIDYAKGNFINVNEQFLKLTCFEKEYFLGQNFKTFLNSNVKNKLATLKIQLKEKSSFDPIKLNFLNQKKTNLNIKVSGTLVDDISGTKHILCTFEDITSQTKLEKNLKNTISSSKEQNEQLLNFAHMVSHNLKTHATNFSLLLNFLNAEKGKNQRSKLMNMLFNASDNLSETIKGLREIVAVKSKINDEKKMLSLNEHIFQVEQNVAGLLKETNGKIINEIPDTVKIKALPAYLNSILTNCITNSIKYRSDEKNPLIILSTVEDKNFTILSIEDNGLGIDLEKFGHKLFGLYNTFHRNKESRGIGLYITKNQIEAMNGKITVTSAPNEGSIFKIYFNKK